MFCTTQMTIHMYKVNLYTKYQSAVEILSILASRVYCRLKMPLNTVFVSSRPLKRARWPPTVIAILDPTWLVEYLCQASLQIYGRFFFRGITLTFTGGVLPRHLFRLPEASSFMKPVLLTLRFPWPSTYSPCSAPWAFSWAEIGSIAPFLSFF